MQAVTEALDNDDRAAYDYLHKRKVAVQREFLRGKNKRY